MNHTDYEPSKLPPRYPFVKSVHCDSLESVLVVHNNRITRQNYVAARMGKSEWDKIKLNEFYLLEIVVQSFPAAGL